MSTQGNLIKIFEYALNQEETGKGFFQYSLQRLGIGAAVSACERLVEEEEKHIQFIGRILEDLKGGRDIDPSAIRTVVLEPSNFFDQRAKSEFLEQCVEGSMVPDVTVFNTAWLIEKDISEFYANAARQTEGKAKDALVMLANWEKAHEAFFKEYRDKLSEVYSRMPWGG
jgi:rubrerythrin